MNFLLFAALGVLILLNYVVIRYGDARVGALDQRRREALGVAIRARNEQARIEAKAKALEAAIEGLQTSSATAAEKLAELQARVKGERAKERKRYYVFDNTPERYQTLWEVVVRCDRDAQAGRRMAKANWDGDRTYIITGVNEAEIRERMESRFPPNEGYKLTQVKMSRLALPKPAMTKTKEAEA